MRGRGGCTVDLAWPAGKLTTATLRSHLGHPCQLRLGDLTADFLTKPGRLLQLDGELKPR